jgi:selenocysteine lyase/cysteine desulfurase
MAPPHESDAQRLAALRELLPATGAGIYLDTATAGPLPAETAAAMREADEWELRVGRAFAGRDEDVVQREEEARAVVAALIVADPDHMTLTAGRRQALFSALAGAGLGASDRVALSASNDEAVLGATREFCAAVGAESVVFEAGGVPADARVIVVPHAAPLTGGLIDVAGLRASLAADVLLVVDASWSVGAVPVAVDELTADVVFFAADRWALAPEGTAAVWRRAPTPASMGDRLPRTTLLGLARSVGWLEMYVGLDWIHERGVRLAEWLADELCRIDGIELLSPRERMATIVSFRLPQPWTPEEAADELGRRVFAIVRPLPALSAVRVSVGWFNTEDELRRFVEAVAELARHTLATLPRKATLTVL